MLIVMASLLGAMVMHGLFNYLVGARLLGGLAFLAALGLAWRSVFLLIRRALVASPYAPGSKG